MRARFARERLTAAFFTASAVAPARSPKPILKNVRLSATENRAELTATDLEIGIRVELDDVQVEAPGMVVLKVDQFGSILRELPDQSFLIEAEPDHVTVKGERSQFRLQAIDPMEFPKVDTTVDESFHRIPARLFGEMIRRTIFSTDNESSRYALGGILWELDGNKAIAVGTDGRRLAKMEGAGEAIGGHSTKEAPTIIPTKAMQIMERSVGMVSSQDSDGDVRLCCRSQDAVFAAGAISIRTSLCEGRFPRWRDVLPKRRETPQVMLTAGPFYSAVRQAQIATSDESRGVEFSFADGILSMNAKAADIGQSHIELPVAYQGPATTVTLDPRYLGDFLKVLDSGSSFAFDFTDSESAVTCRTDDGYEYVIMPLARDKKK